MPFGLYPDLYLQFALACHGVVAFFFYARSASGFALAALACHLFDVLIEAFVAQRLVLIEGESDVADGMVIELGAEQCAVGALAFFIGCA